MVSAFKQLKMLSGLRRFPTLLKQENEGSQSLLEFLCACTPNVSQTHPPLSKFARDPILENSSFQFEMSSVYCRIELHVQA